jgi:hypothetical protein
MTARRLELFVWGLALGLFATGTVQWHRAVPRVTPTPSVVSSTPRPLRVMSADSLSSAVDALVQGDPFRLAHQPAGVPYRPNLEEGGPPPSSVPKPPRPSLALAGVVGGPPWEALLDGVPGREGSVLVRQGDVLGDLTIRAVGRDSVVVRGVDTTWRLTVRRPWQ